MTVGSTMTQINQQKGKVIMNTTEKIYIFIQDINIFSYETKNNNIAIMRHLHH